MSPQKKLKDFSYGDTLTTLMKLELSETDRDKYNSIKSKFDDCRQEKCKDKSNCDIYKICKKEIHAYDNIFIKKSKKFNNHLKYKNQNEKHKLNKLKKKWKIVI